MAILCSHQAERLREWCCRAAVEGWGGNCPTGVRVVCCISWEIFYLCRTGRVCLQSELTGMN